MTAFHIDKNKVTKVGIASLFDAKIGAITFLSLGGNKLTEDEIEKIKEKNQNTLITNY